MRYRELREYTEAARREYWLELSRHLPSSLNPNNGPAIDHWPLTDSEIRQIEKVLFQMPEWLSYWARFEWRSFQRIPNGAYHYDKGRKQFSFYDVPTLCFMHGELSPNREWLTMSLDGEVIPRESKYAHHYAFLPTAVDLCRDIVDEARSEQKWLNGTYYIRFGKWPKNERSRNWLRRDEEVYEPGVSVYHTRYNLDERRWEIETSVDYATIAGTMQSLIYGDKPIYLVQGDEINEEGADGEPLLHNVRKVKELHRHDVFVPGIFDPREDD